MYNKFIFVIVAAIWPILAIAQTCESIVNQALEKFSFPNIEVKANAGGRTYQDIENTERFYVGLSISIPLYSGRERRYSENQRIQKKKELLKAIADVKNALNELQLHRKLLEYRRKRVEKAIEDNEKLLQELQKIEELKAEIRSSEAILKAYGIPPKLAKTCKW